MCVKECATSERKKSCSDPFYALCTFCSKRPLFPAWLFLKDQRGAIPTRTLPDPIFIRIPTPCPVIQDRITFDRDRLIHTIAVALPCSFLLLQERKKTWDPLAAAFGDALLPTSTPFSMLPSVYSLPTRRSLPSTWKVREGESEYEKPVERNIVFIHKSRLEECGVRTRSSISFRAPPPFNVVRTGVELI